MQPCMLPGLKTHLSHSDMGMPAMTLLLAAAVASESSSAGSSAAVGASSASRLLLFSSSLSSSSTEGKLIAVLEMQAGTMLVRREELCGSNDTCLRTLQLSLPKLEARFLTNVFATGERDEHRKTAPSMLLTMGGCSRMWVQRYLASSTITQACTCRCLC